MTVAASPARALPLRVDGDRLVVGPVAIPARGDGLFTVTAVGGVVTEVAPAVALAGSEPSGIQADAGGAEGPTLELWPGYVETHAHVTLPPNWDDSVDDPRIVALQYVFHGVTHVVDMFGFPLAEEAWAAGRAASALPWPEVVHSGYAVTSMRDAAGRTGHGVEFPAPVHVIGIADDVEDVIVANERRGASFLKVMFTEGMEQPDSPIRFSRLTIRVLERIAAACAERGLPAMVDCNTLDEVRLAHAAGFRLFAHSVRDVVLSDEDWDALDGAVFASTLAGLSPMIHEREAFLAEYSRPGFEETQDAANTRFVETIAVPYGIEFNCQETRTEALRVMRANALAALHRGRLLVGTDSGNTGAYHGYSLLTELDLLAGSDPQERAALAPLVRRAATVTGQDHFRRLGGGPSLGGGVLEAGDPATFNLLRPSGAGSPSDLPEVTVVNGVPVDREAVAAEIETLRATPTKGKVQW